MLVDQNLRLSLEALLLRSQCLIESRLVCVKLLQLLVLCSQSFYFLNQRSLLEVVRLRQPCVLRLQVRDHLLTGLGQLAVLLLESPLELHLKVTLELLLSSLCLSKLSFQVFELSLELCAPTTLIVLNLLELLVCIRHELVLIC